MKEIEAAVAQVFTQFLNFPVREDDNIVMADCSAWNSLKHIELILAMEERFDIMFDGNDIARLNTQQRFVEKIRELSQNA